MTACTSKIRPFRPVNDTEIACERPAPHGEGETHAGVLSDYAWPGSRTEINWLPGDRREFIGQWPGNCGTTSSCILPDNHRGRCAQ
jgi:hypothetical protein